MKIVQRISAGLFVTLVLFLGNVHVALADSTGWLPTTGGGGDADLIKWVETILKYFIGLSSLIAVGILVFNAVMYMTASGDDNKIAKATKGITFAIIGLVIAGIAWLIVNWAITALINPA